MGIGSGFGIGATLNHLTGVTAASAQNQKYAIHNALLNNAMQKEFAKNAHQWEMEDLKKAGLNPALTATGGSGASASGGGSFGGSGGSVAGNPLDMINSLVGMQNQTSAIDAQVKLQNAETLRIIEMLPLDKEEKRKIIQNLGLTGEKTKAETKYTNERARGFFETKSHNRAGNTFLGGTSTGETYTRGW